MKNDKKLLYLAGRLFSESDQRQRIYERQSIIEAFGENVRVFSPLENNPANDKSQLPSARSIFNGDTNEIIDSDFIFAELDGEDAGVMAELGLVWGINYMRDKILKLLAFDHVLNEDKEYEKLEEGLYAILSTIPEKKVVTHLTDIRVGTAGEYDGAYVPFGYNQYVIGLIESMGGSIHSSVTDAIEELVSGEGK